MKRCLPLALLLCALSAQAGDLSLNVGADVDSSYVFRGAKRGPLGIVGHLNAACPVARYTSVIANVDQYLRVDTGVKLAETTAEVGLRFRPPLIGRWAMAEGGLTWYSPSRDLHSISFNPENTRGKSSQEFFLRTRFQHVPFAPSLNFYKDINQRSALNMQLSASRSFHLQPWRLDVTGLVDWQFGNGIQGWRAAGIRSAFGYQLGSKLSIGPSLDLWFPRNSIDRSAKGFRPVIGFGFNWAPDAGAHTKARVGALGPLP